MDLQLNEDTLKSMADGVSKVQLLASLEVVDKFRRISARAAHYSGALFENMHNAKGGNRSPFTIKYQRYHLRSLRDLSPSHKVS